MVREQLNAFFFFLKKRDHSGLVVCIKFDFLPYILSLYRTISQGVFFTANFRLSNPVLLPFTLMLNISNRRSRPKLRQHNQNPLQTPKNKCLYTNYTYILWYEATFLFLETHSWFNMWPVLRSTVHASQSWCKQVFKALILRNGSRYQQLRFHWIRSKEWSALQEHANPCFSANLSACQDRIVLFWNELLILTKAQRVVSRLIPIHLNKQLPEMKRPLRGTFSPSVTRSALLPQLEPVQSKSWSVVAPGVISHQSATVLTLQYF